jgi:sporadic carbohydrate cluster 2OG-Fe(II) oxygenase
MLNSKYENNFKKNGYAIEETTNHESLDYLQNKILLLAFNSEPKLKKIYEKFKNPQKFFENLHKYIELKNLNNFRLKIINGINKDKKFRENYYLVAKDLLEDLVGNELAMQNKLNLSIQFPKDKTSMLPMHSDIYAGESPFEVVIWIPLMNVQASTHSMFITTPEKNKSINKEITTSKSKTIIEIYNKHKNKFKFIKINYGQVLLFTPVLMHGNTINSTSITRVSLNCRFKSLLSPYDVYSKTHRNIPHFYRPLSVKPLTKIGFNFINGVAKNKFKISSKF